MYDILFCYLAQHKELPIPGIGTFFVERQPAVIDFPSKKIYAPTYAIRLEPDSYVPGENFFTWLSQRLNLTVRETIFRFNDFAFEMKNDLAAGNRILWNGVGELKKKRTGDIVLDPDPMDYGGETIAAEKILRENAEHAVRVGEDQKTSTEMAAYLEKEENKKIPWWIVSLAVAVLALMFIGWYLSENGIEIFSIGNSVPLHAGETPSGTYRIVP